MAMTTCMTQSRVDRHDRGQSRVSLTVLYAQALLGVSRRAVTEVERGVRTEVTMGDCHPLWSTTSLLTVCHFVCLLILPPIPTWPLSSSYADEMSGVPFSPTSFVPPQSKALPPLGTSEALKMFDFFGKNHSTQHRTAEPSPSATAPLYQTYNRRKDFEWSTPPAAQTPRTAGSSSPVSSVDSVFSEVSRPQCPTLICREQPGPLRLVRSTIGSRPTRPSSRLVRLTLPGSFFPNSHLPSLAGTSHGLSTPPTSPPFPPDIPCRTE
jgi:hypothetical protein